MKKILTAMFAMALTMSFATAALADHHAVKTASKEGLGSYLTDAKGMTLYMFKKDTAGHSACAGECVQKWPLYYREQVAPPAGTTLDEFGTITREDGAKQTTFRGYPLYYFIQDQAAGDTKGQGVKDVWYVIDPGTFMKQ
jgi:predicted lipoprotein with Yx(FWY)xxD motif